MPNNIDYIAKYQKVNTIQINIRLNKKYDTDIIEHLNRLGDKGKATYIKELIRKEIARQSSEYIGDTD